MIIKSFLIWLSIIPLAILNGALRVMVINPLIGEQYGQLASGVLLCIIIYVVCWFGIPKIGRGTAKTYWIIGLLWMLLTVIFESGLVLLTGGNFTELIKAYDISTGNLWLFVVIFMGIAPRLSANPLLQEIGKE